MRDFVAERDIAMAEGWVSRLTTTWAMACSAQTGRIWPLATGDARIGRHGVIYVVDGRGRVLFHPDPNALGDLSAEPLVRQALSSITGAGNGRFADGFRPTLASFAAVGSTGWRVVIEEPLADIIVPILRFTSVLPALVAMAGILSLIVIYFSVRTIVRPLQHLSEKAMQITGGELGDLQQDVGGVEEIRQLHYALRDMVERHSALPGEHARRYRGHHAGPGTERARVSRELHDETVQALVAIGQRTQLAQRALDRGEPSSATEDLQADSGAGPADPG